MGALVVKEFVDRGESARSANRPEPQKMLRYLKDAGDVDYVIVHKLDRLARNRADDVKINRAFDEASVRLISTSENIDQSPGGILLHGIMSSIDEFYSRNLANGVIKGMGERARNGETLGKAPLGVPQLDCWVVFFGHCLFCVSGHLGQAQEFAFRLVGDAIS